ncbi:phytoene desaturase family protein [Sphingosinicella soli]|uniref:Pyridine nucleotide-disulfide oxidoreductase domain-containing protein 2 n=1 Tax=Sphingosinicella soli TaxID=333708 RepID=A0A7W7F7Q3_9SPHN|nr:NAD(P)/FAD-dependent oxidoreductase [Sphingosinicella soli]MBB4633711.1 phytoene dehydrogenase-like protein [Sphingosinicella soli]
MNSPARYDAVVVGAGHNGLTAAAYLGRAGLKVLVLERREIIGGACVTEEVIPGHRVSFTSYFASMLMPTVIRDLGLAGHGLRMIGSDPLLAVGLEPGRILRWWADPQRAADEIRAISPRDAEAFLRVERELKALAAYLQPFFLEPPPDLAARGLDRVREAWRLFRRFRRLKGEETSRLVNFLTGSLGDYLDRHFESEDVKRMFLANNVYGKHGGPYEPGSAIGLLFHLLSGGDDAVQGFSGHVIGGMGAITQAIAACGEAHGVEIRCGTPVARILVEHGHAAGVELEDGSVIHARIVLSNADPKRTFLGLVEAEHLPETFRQDIAAIKMAGPSAKLNLALTREPTVLGRPADADPRERSLLTMVPTLEGAQRIADAARRGEISDDLWIDCVIPSLVDDTLCPPGKAMMTCFIQYLPYCLARGTWDERREELGDSIVRQIARWMPDLPELIEGRVVLTPLDLERTYGLTEGNIFHGDLNIGQLFSMRPTPQWSQYRTPVKGLYLCGAGAHPGGGVTGAPGHNAAHQVLRDRKAGR